MRFLFYSNEKTSMTKDVLNAKKAKREAETKLEERNSFIEELQVFFSKIITIIIKKIFLNYMGQ